MKRLHRADAAVDLEFAAGYKAGLVGSKIQNSVGNVIGFGNTTDRDLPPELFQGFFPDKLNNRVRFYFWGVTGCIYYSVRALKFNGLGLTWLAYWDPVSSSSADIVTTFASRSITRWLTLFAFWLIHPPDLFDLIKI